MPDTLIASTWSEMMRTLQRALLSRETDKSRLLQHHVIGAAGGPTACEGSLAPNKKKTHLLTFPECHEKNTKEGH